MRLILTLLERGFRTLNLLLLQGLLNEKVEIVRINGLRNVVVSPDLQRFDRALHRGIRSNDDNGDVLVGFPDPFEQFNPVHAGHHDIQQNDVPVLLLQLPQRGNGVFC